MTDEQKALDVDCALDKAFNDETGAFGVMFELDILRGRTDVACVRYLDLHGNEAHATLSEMKSVVKALEAFQLHLDETEQETG